MSETILYYSPMLNRPIVPVSLVKYFGSDIKCVDIASEPEAFAKEFPMKKCPALIGPNGFKLTEAIAINNYIIKSSGNEEEMSKLLGTCIKSESDILKWESLAVSDLIIREFSYITSIIGWRPYDEKVAAVQKKELDTVLGIYEEHLAGRKYLVTDDHITLGDLASAGGFSFGFFFYYGEDWRSKYPNITRWYRDVTNSPYLKEFFQDKPLLEKTPETPK